MKLRRDKVVDACRSLGLLLGQDVLAYTSADAPPEYCCLGARIGHEQALVTLRLEPIALDRLAEVEADPRRHDEMAERIFPRRVPSRVSLVRAP